MIVTYILYAQRYYMAIAQRGIVPRALNQEGPMRSHLLHIAVLIAAFGVSTSMFAATLA